MVWLTDARTPEGMRLYAIGDVHGCANLLRDLHHRIAADLEARPVADWRIIHLGDYVDRGPDSRGTIDFLIEQTARDPCILCLRGNHEIMFCEGLAGGGRMRELWLQNGGVEALQSYGIDLSEFQQSFGAEASALEILPEAHRIFLDSLAEELRFGDYFFVHAGIDPELKLSEQPSQAKLWIRDPFLESDKEFEAVVIHGHTPVVDVEVRANRIGIDTGAVFGGRLSCLVLENAEKGLLTAKGLLPLPPVTASAGDQGAERSLHPIKRFFRQLHKRG